ncbi:two-partner secretion domain-containing protein [Leptolyngbya sp. NIES-2104]|uniref:two-partner secretion domain-containing protein n=1 Tax=Leptolyngbya sp. NIES-2104 TaxID=1552121 RepID=UPI0006EC774D|nr:filamentous hemagglutinin N-terminal domain-containing protein [Leptolyngbya sp. NIES-2104]GAP93528.1 putative hemagglutinin-related protein [Leptolyngbya sp. NIES-2104]
MNPARFLWTTATLIAALGFVRPVIAQIIPDDTMGNERSTVLQDATFNGVPLNVTINGVVNPVDVIIEGARRGNNVFHSFSQFNAALNRGTYFFAPSPQTQNIVTRVTGNLPSNILGRLGTFQIVGDQIFSSNANLFLINPNGILFGNNASLDVGGAFVATTANAVRFGDNTFSATNPEPVSDVLQVNPSAFLFNRIPTADITVRANSPNGIENAVGLAVPQNQNLILLGGNINLDGARLTALGGRVELGAVAGTGIVELAADGSLRLPAGVDRADVQLSDATQIDVSLLDQGNIGITANNIRLTGNSRISAGIDARGGSPDTQAGDIALNATGTVELTEESRILNSVNSAFLGNSGDINITATDLFVTGGGQISTSTFGVGEAGNVNLFIRDRVSLTGGQSAIFTNVERNATGNGGNLLVTANALELINGGQLIASTDGKGNAGNVTVDVRDRVFLTGFEGDLNSTIFSRVGANATGDGGNVRIFANTLDMTNGAVINASTLGQGSAGIVRVEVQDQVTLNDSAILSVVTQQAQGNGGELFLSANTLELLNGAQLSASSSGRGNAGNVTVQVRDRVSLDGNSPTSSSTSAIFSSLNDTGVGNSGNLFISANTLSLINEARLNASTSGKGNAGNVTIEVGDRLLLDNSFVFSSVVENAEGKGGNLVVTADVIDMRNGGQLIASTNGKGNAGNVTVTGRDRVLLRDTAPNEGLRTAIFSSVEDQGEGNSGNLSIFTTDLEMSDRSQLTASTAGRGNAGNVRIEANGQVRLDNATIFSRVGQNAVGTGGSVFVGANTLDLLNGGQISVSSLGTGNAGNVRVQVGDRMSVSGASPTEGFTSAIFTTVEQNAVGKGGDLFISARTLDLSNGGRFAASTSGQGDAGNVRVEVADRLSLNNAFILSSVEGSGIGQGGNLFVSAGTLEMTNGGQLVASTGGRGDGGNVTVEVRDRMLLSGSSPTGGFSSAILSGVGEGSVGKGGNLVISANSLRLEDGGQFVTSTRGTGNAGNVTVNVSDRMVLTGSIPDGEFSSAIFSSVLQQGVGKGGNLFISANSLELSNGAQLAVNTLGQGDAGNIALGAVDKPIRSLLISGISDGGFSSGLFASTDFGAGGNIRIYADQIRLSDGAVVDARTFRTGNSGTIDIQTRNLDLLRGSQILALTQGSGSANSITITATDRLFVSGVDSTYEDRLIRFDPGRIAPISPESGIYTRSTAPENAGSAGSIFLTAPRIELDDRARIDAQSSTVDGGNISIRAVDRLLLRNNSQITATAGTETEFGNGGNINIDARFIIAVPKENSDISANASQGSGGRVTLNVTGGVLGIEARSQSSLLSDITATSAQGPTGVVTLNTPDTNSLQNSLTQLSQTEINTNELLANSCIVRDRQSGSFYITGTGGLPAKPTDVSEYPTGAIQSPVASGQERSIAEPQGIYQLPNGKLVMVRDCSN